MFVARLSIVEFNRTQSAVKALPVITLQVQACLVTITRYAYILRNLFYLPDFPCSQLVHYERSPCRTPNSYSPRVAECLVVQPCAPVFALQSTFSTSSHSPRNPTHHRYRWRGCKCLHNPLLNIRKSG
jgi:hypothetical protein